jgi:hypothetical protein
MNSLPHGRRLNDRQAVDMHPNSGGGLWHGLLLVSWVGIISVRA